MGKLEQLIDVYIRLGDLVKLYKKKEKKIIQNKWNTIQVHLILFGNISVIISMLKWRHTILILLNNTHNTNTGASSQVEPLNCCKLIHVYGFYLLIN